MSFLKLVNYLTQQAVKCSNKIAIIALYGSLASDSQSSYSDLDMYAIVDDPDETDLPYEFVYRDRAVSFWEVDWQTAEKMSSGKRLENPWSVATALFLNSKILYARSEEDRSRFELLKVKTRLSEKEQLTVIMDNFIKLYSLIELIHMAKEKDDLVNARWAAWNLVNQTVDHLSRLNNKYLTKNWGSNLRETFKFSLLPEDFPSLVETLCSCDDYDEIILAGRTLVSRKRELVCKRQQQLGSKRDSKTSFADNYSGIKEYLNKILSACNKQDLFLASYASTELQLWLAEEIAKREENYLFNSLNFNTYSELGTHYESSEFPDLSASITRGDFEQLKRDVKDLGDKIRLYCKKTGEKLLDFDEWEEIEVYFNEKKCGKHKTPN